MSSPPAETVLKITDPLGPRELDLNGVDRMFLGTLRDERDLPFVRLSLKLSALLWTTALLFYSGLVPAWLGVIWIPALFLGFAGPFTLMLHAVCHRKLYKKQHSLLNAWIHWGIGPFFGHTPESFYNHHVGMHHPENVAWTDLSSTIGYRRDSLGSFFRYWARFFFAGTPELLTYLWTRRRKKIFWSMVRGETAWYLAVAVLLVLAPGPTLALFVVPWFLMRMLMMSGNFAQHAFVDVDDPTDSWRNSTVLLNARYNHKCWNDGYHIVHHIKPMMHWSEMAVWFEEHLEEFGQHDAIVFDGLGNNQTVFFCLMRGDYDRLAKHMVRLPGAPARTHEQKIAFLKDRAQRTAGSPTPLLRGALPPRAAPAQ